MGSFKDKFPYPEFREVVFVGRSNVGKSSLINFITGRNIARVSKTPGKTRFINYFVLNDKLFLVDVPGYGYASVPKRERRKWKIMMERYFHERKDNIKCVFLLVDGKVGFTELDNAMIEWLKSLSLSFVIVFTKVDKLNQSEMAKLKNRIKDIGYRYVMTSVREGVGKKDLLSLII